MLSVVYVSTEARRTTEEQLAGIMAEGRARNTALGITGLFAYRGGNCLGILEGPDTVVLARFEEIQRDPRHTNVRLLYADQVTERSFPDWTMAFRSSDPRVAAMPGFSDLFAPGRRADRRRNESRARALLEWFRLHPLAPLTGQPA